MPLSLKQMVLDTVFFVKLLQNKNQWNKTARGLPKQNTTTKMSTSNQSTYLPTYLVICRTKHRMNQRTFLVPSRSTSSRAAYCLGPVMLNTFFQAPSSKVQHSPATGFGPRDDPPQMNGFASAPTAPTEPYVSKGYSGKALHLESSSSCSSCKLLVVVMLQR